MTEHGWKPMPTSMKVLFIILLVSIFSSLISVINVNLLLNTGTFFLGFYIKDALSLTLYYSLSLLAVVILALALWKRYKWTAKYALIFYAFGIVNIILMMVNIGKFSEIINLSMPATSPEAAAFATQMFAVMMIFGLCLGVACGVLFLILVWRARKYFEQ